MTDSRGRPLDFSLGAKLPREVRSTVGREAVERSVMLLFVCLFVLPVAAEYGTAAALGDLTSANGGCDKNKCLPVLGLRHNRVNRVKGFSCVVACADDCCIHDASLFKRVALESMMTVVR